MCKKSLYEIPRYRSLVVHFKKNTHYNLNSTKMLTFSDGAPLVVEDLRGRQQPPAPTSTTGVGDGTFQHTLRANGANA